MRELLQNGVIPQVHDARQLRKEGKGRTMSERLRKERSAVPPGFLEDRTTSASNEHFDLDRDFIIAGQAVGGMHEITPAGDLVRRMMSELVAALGALPRVVVAAEAQQARL